jgi:serine/threonine-protein kinase
MVGHVLLGKYRISRLLDEGGMSKIHLAQQSQPQREVVVKVLKEGLRGSAKACEHFRREIHIMSRFQHPHAVAYYDAAPNDRQGPVLVMEYLRGVDLGVLLHRGGRFTPERAGRLLAQLCEVLQAAHQAGIDHRDLKPGNLMVLHPGTPQEQVKLMDFGLSKMTALLYISPDEIFDWTLPAAARTPEYISPEQVRGNEMDGRGDLYSVGVVLFELLTGRRPFEGASAEDLMRAHAEREPPGFSAVGVGDVPPAVERLVQSCLAKHPDGRPQSTKELADRYEQAVGKRLTLAVRRAAPPPAPNGHAAAFAPPRAADRYAVQQSVEAAMPESIALLKLKGFIHDLGGDVVESVPGLIRVRVAAAKSGAGGPSRMLDRARQAAAAPRAAELELHMERRDASRLTVTLIIRNGHAGVTPEWRAQCERIGRDFQAYLGGR